MRYYLVSLGCPKNTVDTHGMARLLDKAGHVPVSNPDEADLLVVNTCGFIADARAESLQVLRELAARKRPAQKLIAAGCLAQRAGDTLMRQVRGVDGILGTRRWSEIGELIADLERRPAVRIGDPPPSHAATRLPRVATLGASAYLKIADGCSAPCAFCAIPAIKGPLHSRPHREVIADAHALAARGVQEIVVIAQDTTAYGQDRGEHDALPELLADIVAATEGVPWIRLMYAYPQHITPRLIECMARHERICHYLDLPLQHAHPDTLRRMRRPADVERVRRLIADLREAMPDIALRTSFIVGYPGETEAEFHTLEEFIVEMQFDKVGVFTYSPEKGTPAFDLPNRVPEPVKRQRYDRLMSRQQEISLQRNRAQVGRVLQVLIEGQGVIEDEDGNGTEMISIGRTYRDAPEIDGLVLVDGAFAPGSMIPVEITGAMEYDLIGRCIG